ncbi:MAG: LysE family transporter [Bacteroidota bacterium]|nr:LysE family transporter [Bacteroidota bacterium]
MKQSIKIFYWGMLISFLGSLPPGIINLAAIQIAGKQGNGAAMAYAIGSMLAEVIVVRLALSGMSWLTRSQKFFHILEWMTAGLLILFSAACFIAANQMQEFPVVLPGLALPSFLAGIVLSAINPLHIPFWLGWSTVLMNKGVLAPQPKQYNLYILGIAAGTIAGFTTFIFGGQYLLKAFQSNQYLINCIIGMALFITAFFHIRKMIFVPVAIRHAKLFRRL